MSDRALVRPTYRLTFFGFVVVTLKVVAWISFIGSVFLGVLYAASWLEVVDDPTSADRGFAFGLAIGTMAAGVLWACVLGALAYGLQLLGHIADATDHVARQTRRDHYELT